MRAEYKFYEMLTTPLSPHKKIPNQGQSKNGIQNIKIMEKAKWSKIINKKNMSIKFAVLLINNGGMWVIYKIQRRSTTIVVYDVTDPIGYQGSFTTVVVSAVTDPIGYHSDIKNFRRVHAIGRQQVNRETRRFALGPLLHFLRWRFQHRTHRYQSPSCSNRRDDSIWIGYQSYSSPTSPIRIISSADVEPFSIRVGRQWLRQPPGGQPSGGHHRARYSPAMPRWGNTLLAYPTRWTKLIRP